MAETPLVIEVALNGGTPKARNPNVPRTPAEIAELTSFDLADWDRRTAPFRLY